MNLYTDRLDTWMPSECIINSKIKKSQEYFVLALLRYIDYERYGNLCRKDAPDLQDENNILGVEVVSAETEEWNKTVYLFSESNLDHVNREKSLERIDSLGVGTVIEKNQVKMLCSGGGYNCKPADMIRKVIEKKSKKRYKAKGQFKNIELAIVKLDLEVSEFKNECISLLNELCESDEINSELCRIHIISPQFYLHCDMDNNPVDEIGIDKDVYNRLHKLARMTAEEIIKFEDIEWN